MFRRVSLALLLAASLLVVAGCTNKKSANPLAHINSKQPDKVLYDRAMDAMKEHKYDVARLTLQTLINTYPDSEFVARAKLAVGESWYEEGSAASLTQAENEFRDFITFFPNMPEAAEAQLKIADIHYRQMEKPDRDYTHAMRAEDEYRQLLTQYPDSKLAPTARLRLLEVQEVLAERQFRIAHFYFVRGSLLPAIARAKTLTDTYPLYSRSDEALWILGQSYEQQAERVHLAPGIHDAVKSKLEKEYLDSAAEAYSRIVTRYPAEPRYQDARHRLEALKRPVPTPTPEAVALNKKELASHVHASRYERFVNDMGKHPDLSEAVKVGQPTLVDPKETDAPYLVREINSAVKADTEANAGSGKVAIETASTADGKIPANQPVPRSETTPDTSKSSDTPTEAPAQLDESKSSATPSATTETASNDSSTNTKTDDKDDKKDSASSRKAKKKFHIHVPIPW